MLKRQRHHGGDPDPVIFGGWPNFAHLPKLPSRASLYTLPPWVSDKPRLWCTLVRSVSLNLTAPDTDEEEGKCNWMLQR